jgi:DNA invertase Pin-like site-specific DNA recombinase
VSSLDQRVDRQLDGITVERTFTDTVSGKDTDRPQLEAMLGFVRDGDTVIVHSMDRLARNLEDLRRIVPSANRQRRASPVPHRTADLHR